MSKNSKNARSNKEAKEISINRQKRTECVNPGRTANATKKKAWWQTGDRSYKSFVKGKGKPQRASKEAGVVEVAIEV